MSKLTDETFDPLTARGIKLQGEYFADCNLLVDIIAKDTEAYKELERERNELAAQVKRLRETIELVAEWNSHTTELSVNYGSNGVRDFYRRIAKSSLSEQPPAALVLKTQWQDEAVKEFLEILDESIGVERDAGRNVSGDTIEMIGRAARKFKQRAQEGR